MRFLSLLAALWMLQSCAGSTPLQQRCAEGHRHLDDQQWDRAERSYDRALKLSPGYGPALVGRASARIGLNRYAEALSDVDAALAGSPDRLEWRSRRGVLLHALGRYEEALVELDRVLARSPNHAASLTGRAMTYLRLKRCPEAMRDLRRARRLGVPIPDSWLQTCPDLK
ncbi:tetratricopeptide repeat protein [Myxococcota bacterium]|jgi:tetratricopeptide (TPR) repeat protein|nr:tetratricopeptide repeat protein [Myxococcota bacterium]MBU1412763.1 tetratricopeptide repeat protein [Myxococcota bacterium]MBU1510186.1 tetratricopeptide repeat protein [Myxococcota bacterium]